MKYRIVKETDGKINRFFVQSKSKFSFFWKPVLYYYSSEFSDMPGWWTDHVNSEDEAFNIIENIKVSTKKAESTVIFEMEW